MTTHSLSSYQSAIDKAFAAIQAGNRKQAIRWTNLAVAQNPKEEDPWLLMAYLASPKASIDYLKHALTLNPFSLRARKGLEWAQKRFKSQLNEEQNQNFPNQELLEITHKTAVKAVRSAPKLKTKTHKKRPPASKITTNDQKIIGGFFAVASAAFIVFIFWLTSPDIVKGGFNNSSNSSGPALVLQVTATPTNTATATPTNTPTQTPTFTPTIIPTSSPTPSPTATSTPTQIPGPTAIPIPPYSADQKWIEVDLTEQRLTAYIGNTAVRSFIVSTGTKYTPTVQGVFTVYRIYKSASMSGPGYNLPGVPNILYFFEGYSIHGTYWHNNFGTPMSHGCVNMSIEDSAWIYNFGGLGTIVYVKY